MIVQLCRLFVCNTTCNCIMFEQWDGDIGEAAASRLCKQQHVSYYILLQSGHLVSCSYAWVFLSNSIANIRPPILTGISPDCLHAAEMLPLALNFSVGEQKKMFNLNFSKLVLTNEDFNRFSRDCH